MFLALYPSEEKRFLSKIHIIREMFDDIDLARKNGVTLILILDAIKQKSGLNISYDELRSLLYVIRKERGLKPNSNKKENIKTEPLINKPFIESIQTEIKGENKDEYTPENWENILDKFYAENNPHDRYLALGGKLEDIEGKSLSSKRDMVTQLKHKLERKYKGIY